MNHQDTKTQRKANRGDKSSAEQIYMKDVKKIGDDGEILTFCSLPFWRPFIHFRGWKAAPTEGRKPECWKDGMLEWWS